MKLFVSNHMEKILEHLKEEMFSSDSTPFTKRMIFVPHNLLKTWIMKELCRDLDIATGFEIVDIKRGIEKVYEASFEKKLHVPQFQELYLAIRVILEATLKEETHNPIYEPILNYLKPNSNKESKRLHILSEKLTPLFLQYGLYGGEMLKKWESSPIVEWQQGIWCKIFCEQFPYWSYPHKSLTASHEKTSEVPLQIHLFGFNTLPQLYLEFFKQFNDVTLYHFSPSRMFWSDHLSKRELLQIKGKVKSDHFLSLEQFYHNQHPLLTHFGTVGKQFIKECENEEFEWQENYCLHEHFLSHSAYKELYLDDITLYSQEHDLTLLSYLKADLLLLRESKPPVNLQKKDPSIQVHVTTSLFREIEVLHTTLLKLIDDSKEATLIAPSDIIVLASNLEEIHPYIEMVFNAEDSPIKAQILVSSTSPVLKSFLHLISLADSNWSNIEFLKLFECPYFSKKHNLSVAELYQIKEWIETSDIRWGDSVEHRNQLLKKRHCPNEIIDPSPAGTWGFGFKKLLYSTLFTSHLEPLSLDNLDFTHADLLGKWIEIMHSVKSDLEMISEGISRPLEEWIHYLKALFESYFGINEDTQEGYDLLNQHLNAFAKVPDTLLQHSFDFLLLKHTLFKNLKKPKKAIEQISQKVRFLDIKEMEIVPSRVIAMIGLCEDHFPRKDKVDPLNKMDAHKGCDFIHNAKDKDRYLFLEAILSAKDVFYLSYCGYSKNDGKEKQPSIVISELFSYLDDAFRIGDQKPSALCIKKAPAHAFDHTCFLDKSFSHYHYKQAQSHYLSKTENNKTLFNLFQESKKIFEKEVKISIQDLMTFGKNPLKSYFQKKLKFSLNDVHHKFNDEEDMSLDPLQTYQLIKKRFEKNGEDIVTHAEKISALPMGPFKGFFKNKILKDIEELKSNLRILKISENELMTIHFSENIAEPHFEKDHLFYPPLEILVEDCKVIISGILPLISPSGIVCNVENTKKDILKIWPLYLIFYTAIKQFNLEFKPHLYLVKGVKPAMKTPFFDDPLPKLKEYLSYYLSSLEIPSPLSPEWTPDMLELDSQEFLDKVQKNLSSPFIPQYNPYLSYSLRNEKLEASSHIDSWQQQGKDLFSDIYLNWYSK